jgi:hypothetical protein
MFVNALYLLVVWVLIPWMIAFWWLWRGWKMVRSPTRVPLGLDWRLRIGLLRRIKGPEAAKRKQEELMKPEWIRLEGYLSVLTGIGILIGGGFILLAWIDRFVSR